MASVSEIMWPMRKAGAAFTPTERRSRRALAHRLTEEAGSFGIMSAPVTSSRTGPRRSLTVTVPFITQPAPLAWMSLAWKVIAGHWSVARNRAPRRSRSGRSWGSSCQRPGVLMPAGDVVDLDAVGPGQQGGVLAGHQFGGHDRALGGVEGLD
jgi:hypothetical protein